MRRLKKFIEHVMSFSSAHLFVVALLGISAILQAFNIALFDSLVSGLYVSSFGLRDLAFNFLLGAVFLSLCGYVSLKTERRFGNGFIPYLLLFLVLQSALFMLYHLKATVLSIDILFFIKWGYRLLLFTGFWSFAFRYIELSMKSKRFLFLVVCEFIGFLSGGLLTYFAIDFLGQDTLFVLSSMSLLILIALLWKISGIEKVMPELQLKKNGGVFEKIQLRLVYLIYSLTFFFMSMTAFVDYTLCLEVTRLNPLSVESSVRFFAVVWSLFGASALFLVALLYTLRRSLPIVNGMMILSFVPLVCVLGVDAQILWVVLFAKVILDLTSYFCVGYYFRILPRPLSHGRKSRLKAARLIIAQPMGFALTALVFYFMPYQQTALLFACGLSFVFLLNIFDCQAEYAKVLLSAFKTFRWRGGRVMMRNEKVLKFVQDKAKSLNAQEAIYFLRVLEEAQVSNLKSHLRHALAHPDEQVRLFALKSIERNNLRMFKKTLSDVMDKDESPLVRQSALDVFCSLGEKYGVEKAVLYLDDVVLRKGALIGLLKSGGQEVLIASEGVNKLATSKNPLHRLEAAQILQQTGLKGFFRLVQKLINDDDVRVQKTALLAAGKMQHFGLIKLIFKALNKMELRDEALQALRMFGASAYPHIEAALSDDEPTDLCKKTLISFLWISEDIESKKVLLKTLKNMPFKLRVYALYYLKNTPLKLSKKFIRQTFIPLIETDFTQALTTLLLIKDFRFSPIYDAQNAFEGLCASLQKDFDKIRQSLLLEIYFYFPSILMKQAVDLLLSDASSEQERKMAESTLDDLLPKSYKKLYLIIKDMPFEERLNRIPSRRLKKEQSMSEQLSFILQSRSYRSAWTKVMALSCIRKLDDISQIKQVQEMLSDNSPIIRENALWVLERLVPDKKELKKMIQVCLKDNQALIRQLALEILQ